MITIRHTRFSLVCAVFSSCAVRASGLALVTPWTRPRQLDRSALGMAAEAGSIEMRMHSTSIAGREVLRDGPPFITTSPSVARNGATRRRHVSCSVRDGSTTGMGTENRGWTVSSPGGGGATSATRNIKATTNEDSGGSSSLVLNVRPEDHNAPIDWLLSRRLPIMSRRFYRRALERGSVKVDGRTVKRFVRVARGSTISVDNMSSVAAGARDRAGAPITPTNYLFPQRLPELRVLYEDPHCAVVVKPAGMVCQPCEAASSGTVLHGLLHHMVQKNQAEEGDLATARNLSQGIVQRLDKATSGVMVVAKNLNAASKFSSLCDDGNIKQQYVAICHGDPGFDSVVNASLYRRSSGKTAAVVMSQAADFGAKNAQTRVRNVATTGGLSLCRADVTNGRMHQVRVHLKWKLCPVVGDKDYGDSEANRRVAKRGNFRVDQRRPLLHSMALEFTHPFTNRPMFFRAPMPPDMWQTAKVILRASGTPEQRQEFEELQELQWKTAPIGGRGAPRYLKNGGERKGARGSASARKAHAAIVAAGMVDR